MTKRYRYIPFLIGALLILFVSCSTKKNTSGSRWWHSFTARYNTYFNGSQAFIEGEKAKLDGHKDDYTKLLPVFLVGNENSRTTGKGSFETAITKSQKAITLHSIKKRPVVSANKRKSAKMKAYLQRKEFNPFLKHAWLMMGKAQFEKGDFFEAAATFSYITRLYAAEPAVASEARQWLARCYVHEDWYYDAEDALDKMGRDSVTRQTLREADATRAELLLRQERFADALPYLQRAARNAKGSYRKARLQYLLAQVQIHLGQNGEAYKSLQRCIKKSPPYELTFNARILQTEVLAGRKGMGKKMIARLKRMARKDNNREYLDQVYYAMGNIYLTEKDTASAIGAYETGRKKGTRNGTEKGVLLLRLGGLYWDTHKFEEAQKCYTEALGMIDKEHEDYEMLSRRSKVLDKLVPYTSAVHLQDSLQELSRMSEEDRNAAIDRVIEALKKKEEEARKASRDSAAQARMEENGQAGSDNNRNNSSTTTQTSQQSTTWYFYNPVAVMQGKQDFQKRWGNRKNEDNWRRSNRTVVAMDDAEGFDYEADDSLQAVADSLEAAGGEMEEAAAEDSVQNDPHHREYYLKQIPFTEEARVASDEIIKDGLYNAGVIEKDDLEDFPLAASTLTRLTTEYNNFDRMPDAYYHLFLLYSRWGKPDKAEEMKRYMAQYYPDNDLTKLITASDYEIMARYGKQIEDSLYAATYQAYRHRNNAEVARNAAVSADKFPNGLNRPKFIFVDVLSRLNTDEPKQLITELRDLLSKYPESDVSPMAGMIVKGLESGRQIGTGTFDLGSLWDRRTAASDSLSDDAAKQRQFTAERSAPFLFVFAYPTDSVDSRKLLYEMAHFNFSTFVVRGFDMDVKHDKGLSQFTISGFNSYDEALVYTRKAYADTALNEMFRHGKILIISKANLDLIGSTFSINDYLQFFDKNFAPIEVAPNLPIEQTAPIEQRYEDEYSTDELERMNNQGSGGTDDDEGEWY